MAGPCVWRCHKTARRFRGDLAYENDRKYAAISGAKFLRDRLAFEVADVDRGTLRFRLQVLGDKLVGDDGAVLERWIPQRNRQFDAGRPVYPTIRSKVDPDYSEAARKKHFTGTVKLSIMVLTNGDVDPDVKVVESSGKDLDQAAIKAVRQWKFTPPREDCSFMENRLTVEVNFRLL